MTLPPSWPALAAIVFLGFLVEAALGFGATVVTVALAANLVSVDELLAAFVPLNVVLSLFFVLRDRRAIAGRALAIGIVPPMVLGLPIGLYALGSLNPRTLRVAFGVFLFVLSAVEIARMRTSGAPKSDTRSPRGARAAEAALLFVGGIVHGAFATGGPMAVYVAGRRLSRDRTVFRATLAALWLLLNLVLVVTYGTERKLDARSFEMTLALAPSLGLGLALGNYAHTRIPERAFRLGIFVLLGVAAIVLVARAWSGG